MEPVEVERGDGVEGVRLGVVWASGCTGGPAPEGLSGAVDRAVSEAEARDVETGRKAVREMLRWGRYKPKGRGKPASEYLLGAAKDGTFPRINNLVDINNLFSLETLLPISIVDLERAGTRRFRLRRGQEGEDYVFNSAGQRIELEDLLLLAALPDDVPRANAVKDSMETKVVEGSREVVAFLYAPVSLEETLPDAVERLAAALREWAGASETATAIV